jgi:hypothetical protein
LENISDGDSNQKHSTDDGVMVSSVNNTGDVASELSNGKYSGVLQTGIYSDSISSNTDIVSRTDPMNIDNTKGGNDDNTSNNQIIIIKLKFYRTLRWPARALPYTSIPQL